MSMEVINKIETQISELENRAKRGNEMLSNILSNLRNLRKEREKTRDEVNVVSGAIHAFKGVLAELKAEDANKKSEAKKLKAKEPVVSGE